MVKMNCLFSVQGEVRKKFADDFVAFVESGNGFETTI